MKKYGIPFLQKSGVSENAYFGSKSKAISLPFSQRSGISEMSIFHEIVRL